MTQWFFMRTWKTLIRLGGCPSWSESSLGAHVILLVLSCAGSWYDPKYSYRQVWANSVVLDQTTLLKGAVIIIIIIITTVVQLVVSFNSSLQWGISQEYSHSDRFDFVFSLRCIDWVRKPLCEPNFLCIFVLRIISGPRVKFVQWKAFNPR